MNFKNEIMLAIRLAREQLNGRQLRSGNAYAQKGDVNWKFIINFLRYHGILGYVWPRLQELCAEVSQSANVQQDTSCAFTLDTLCEASRNAFYVAQVNAEMLWREFIRLRLCLLQEGIPVVPLKGLAFFCFLYHGQGIRQTRDIDLLVKKEDFSRARAVLRGMGYTEKLDGLSEEYWLSVQAQITLHHIADNRIYEVDLHFAFDDQRVSLPWLDAAWERIIGYRMYGQQVEVLSQEDSLLQLALHQRRNLGNPLGMKNTLDACLLLRDYAQSLDWEYLLGQARRMRLCCALYGLLLQAKLFLGQPLPENLREHCHVSAAKAIVLRVFLNSQVYLPYGNKVAYLGHHFLLYDNYREPFKSALDIPREQFAISLNMDPHARKTAIFYQLRVFYLPWCMLCDLARGFA